jgi:hypothetical protein
MSKFYTKITAKLQDFMEAQKIFFVATAPTNGRINLSPKGMDSFRILEENRVIWLNVTGSGNETAAHLNENERITIMFCSFEKVPTILRLYGKGKEIKEGNDSWNELISFFPETPGTRQIFDITIDSAQTSCGMSIPFFEFKGERNDLNDWATKQGKTGIKNYWQNKNQTSIDGLPTKILE